MLDNITKRRIDDCRDILVGKLPDPKSQIEQITIALIYKFMDDMDKEAIELGGKAKFFSDYSIPEPNDPKKQIVVSFEKYSWDNLFDTKVSASEMLKLYSEAIEGMVKNPNIPELFSNIFKNAYLPYRDPETLKMFLKTISEFEYTHSEKLGDAFEYLLSVMGSQGDAGQFRTPRHIIDFLVAAVDPGKNDSILDPACGTAGFLISAFKHIKEKNNNSLTPDERKRLIKNFMGYDISPDMVRLSLVNLYLHGFSDPHIFEYDTLSSEDRWDETFDVVLANPPFMSPKGGIRPHKKFSISSNRSEVLFVDYIAEHLNPKGRAGIIVPEGIIFQSGTAYKALRKMLVDKYLYAVVSLPAGVFNPYSGVKTSILLMDADLAKKSKDILFVKIDNDGYNLGSQRNAVKGGQLEEAVETLKTFRTNCIEGKPFKNNTLAQAVSKTEIGKSGDYNLSGEKYKNQNIISTEYPIVLLDDIVEVKGGKRLPKDSTYSEIKTDYPYIRVADFDEVGIKTKNIKYISSEIQSQIINYTINKEDVYISIAGTIGIVGTIPEELDGANLTENAAKLVIKDRSIINNNYLSLILRTDKSKNQITSSTHAVGVPKLALSRIKLLQIPLPPLSVQEEIVAEIESYQKIIDGAKMVVDNYKPRIEVESDWEMVGLEKLCSIKHGFAFKSEEFDNDGNNKLPIVLAPGNYCEEGGLIFTDKNSRRYNGKVNKEYLFSIDDLTIVMTDLSPKMKILGNPAIIENHNILHNQRIGKIILKSNLIIVKYLYYTLFLPSIKSRIKQTATGTLIKHTSPNRILECEIPLPSIEIQKKIVLQIEKEQALVNANKELIAIYEQKIKDRIAKVWGEENQKTTPKKLSNDLYLAMVLKQMERKIQLNYGEVATQKTVFHLNTFTNQKLDYPFINSNYGTYSYLLKDDLLKNPYLTKEKKGNGEVFVVNTSKENEVLEALSHPENKEFVEAINEVLKIYQTPLINKETENIELLNTVSKVIIDKQTIDLDVVYAAMEEWEINQNGFKTKADKFTKAKVKRMIDLIVKLGLVDRLIK